MTPPRFGPQLDFFVMGGGAMTSALLSRDEIAAALQRRFGFEREKALRIAEREMAKRASFTVVPGELPAPAPDPVHITWPLAITLPWSHLVSDNDRHGAIVRLVGANRTPAPLLIMTAEYREAKGKIMKLVRAQLAGAEPVAIPLRLEARVWLPGGRGKHDVCNFAKAVHDALEEIVYVDDQWLHDVRWIRAGVDVDHPRAELTITPL